MIDITEKKVPHLFRNKYLRNAGSGSVSTSTQSPGQSTPGASVDIVKTDSATVPTDVNVLSALRTLLEIRSRIIASSDTETALSEENTLSSFRIIAEIEAGITEALVAVDEIYLSKTKADTAAEAITFLKGLLVGDNLAFINANGDAEVKNLVTRMKAKVATLEVTGAASVESIAVGKTATTLNLLVQALADIYDLNVTHVATMFRTIIKDYISSETFVPGLMGEGMKIYKALNGDWNLEIDNVVIRKVMTIFELVVSKIRAVNGGLVVSPANGRIKSVSLSVGDPVYYVLEIEGDNQFVADDLVRCQVFTSGQAKYYWVAVASVMPDSILVLKSEFTNGVAPAPGDDLVQMGNRTNKARQGLLYLTASEDGKPRFSVMDGVNSTSTVGKSKVILGCLDGMTDTDFPADFQPSGYGLYAGNVFLKGMFLLRNGKSVETEIDSAKSDVQTAKSDAQAAKNTADTAKSLADAADALLSDIANDDKLTPSEKQATKKEWESILSEKLKNDASADKYGVSKVAYNSAYTTLVLYLAPLLTPITTTSNISGSTFRAKFKAYYDARAEMLSAIYIKAKELTDAAQEKASEAKDKADAITRLFQEFTVAGGLFESKITEVKKYASDKANTAKGEAINDAAGKYNTKSEITSLINQTKEAINLSVTEKISNVQDRITANASAIEVNRKGIALKASQEQVNDIGNRLGTAESSLTVQARQISAAVISVDNLSGLMSSAEAKITPDAIRLTVSEQTKNTAIEYANLAAKLAGAKMLHRDPTFKEGNNGINVYNNSSNGTVVISRVGAAADNPTDSGYQLLITSNGYSNQPGRGGFYFGNQVHVYGEYICKFIAWIPVGSNVCFASNSIGDGGYQKWLTPTAGQGKWAEYVSYVRGGTANTSTTNFYNLDGGAETLNWWLCYATVFECSSAEDTPTRDEVKAGIGITSGGITVFGKFIDFTGRVTFNSLSWDAKDKINNAQSAADTANTTLNRLGGLAYDNAVTLAKLDSTIIDGGYIKTNLINARAIVTGALIAEAINATNISATNLTITGNSIIAGLRVSGNSLSNVGHDNDAYIILRNNPEGTFAGIGANVYSDLTYTNRVVARFACEGNRGGMSNTALMLKASGSTRDNVALDMTGRVKTNGAFGWNGSYEIDAAWNNGWRKIGLSFTNGILTNVYWP